MSGEFSIKEGVMTFKTYRNMKDSNGRLM